MPADPSPSKTTASIGTHVVVELLGASGDTERLEFDIVPDQSADFTRGFLGEGTPLAKAIMDQPAGALLAYLTDETVQVRILAVTASKSWPDKNQAQKREERMRQARQQVERTNAILFASSFSGKWGDYDPDGIDHWGDPDQADQVSR